MSFRRPERVTVVVLNTALIASLLAAAVATLGLAAIWFNRAWAEKSSARFAAFAAGVLVAAACLHLIPEGLAASEHGPFFVLAGYSALFALRTLSVGFNGDAIDGGPAAALITLAGVSFHSFVDGVQYSILFANGMFAGGLVAIGLITHEFVEAIILFALLTQTGLRMPTALALAFVGAAVTTPLGTLASSSFVAGVDQPTLGALLSLAAGVLLFIGATHLITHLRRQTRLQTLVFFGAGASLSLALVVGHH